MKNYSRSRSERYHGNLTSYRFLIKHKNAEFGVDDVKSLQKFFKTSRNQLLKKIYASPVAKKWKKIMRLTTAFKGTGTIENAKGDSHDFPLWRATTDNVNGEVTTKAEFKAQFDETRGDTEDQIEEMFTENQNAYYEESSSQATTLKIDESLCYVETSPIKQHTIKPSADSARKKRSRRKHSNIRSRNKRVDKRKKNRVVHRKRKRSNPVRQRSKFSKRSRKA